MDSSKASCSTQQTIVSDPDQDSGLPVWRQSDLRRSTEVTRVAANRSAEIHIGSGSRGPVCSALLSIIFVSEKNRGQTKQRLNLKVYAESAFISNYSIKSCDCSGGCVNHPLCYRAHGTLISNGRLTHAPAHIFRSAQPFYCRCCCCCVVKKNETTTYEYACRSH